MAKKRKRKFTVRDNPDKHRKRLVVAAFSVCGVLKKALEIAKVNRSKHNRWMEADPKYAAEMEIAKEEAIDTLELEAVRRARDGVKKLVFYKGKPIKVPSDLNNPKSKKEIYVEHQHSDALLMFLLKGNRPQKYRDNAAKLDVDGSLQIKTLDGVSVDDL